MINDKNCFLLELQQDRIMDKIIEKTLGLVTIREVFPSNSVYVIVYQNGKKLHEGFEQ